MSDKKQEQIKSAVYLLDHLNKVLTMVAEGIDDEKLKDYLKETTMLQIHLEGKLNDWDTNRSASLYI